MNLFARVLRMLLVGLMFAWAALPSGPASAAALQAPCCDHAAFQQMHREHVAMMGSPVTDRHHGHGLLCEEHCLQSEAIRIHAGLSLPLGTLRLLRAEPLRASFVSLDRQPVAPPPKA